LPCRRIHKFAKYSPRHAKFRVHNDSLSSPRPDYLSGAPAHGCPFVTLQAGELYYGIRAMRKQPSSPGGAIEEELALFVHNLVGWAARQGRRRDNGG
jgi:hypothetical protein